MGRKDVPLSVLIQTFYGHKLKIGTKFTVLSVMHDKQEKKSNTTAAGKSTEERIIKGSLINVQHRSRSVMVSVQTC